MDFIKLDVLEAITNEFADDRKVGSGGYGDVYRATYEGKAIAVKKLHQLQGLDHKQIYREFRKFNSKFRNLLNIRHQNVVRLIGYCHETRMKYMEHKGELSGTIEMERVLCFEYMHGGSLDRYIQDESSGLEWPTCYKIIKGTCEGLNYLHNSQGKPIYHLNLKSGNILLDRSMTPKIADLGLSRLVASTRTRKREMRTLGFMPPEYVDDGSISKKSKKFDVFSLGVIIMKVLAGNKGYYSMSKMSPKQFIELVIENWTKSMQTPLQEDILRVRTCVEIALRCVATDRNKRPTVKEIVHELEELEANITIMPHLIVQTESKTRQMSLQHLKEITNNFSEDRILGRGGFGTVYKGLLQNGEVVAVKKLVQSTPKSQKQFENEVDLLMKLKHPNVVRLLDYCYETQPLLVRVDEGKIVPALNIERFLCLECMPNGSLDKYITDVSSGHDWHTRYRIIEGISFGLQYLHEEPNCPIIHLDLKPSNILLDENLLPKITDFGLSRLFDNNQTIRTATSSGTLGYMALEYQLRGIITPMADIFSLGVIIMEVITGHRDYPYDIRMGHKDFIKHELQLWRNKLQKEPGYTSLETDCQQIERCIQIGLLCVNHERTKRPTMKKIIDMLQGLEIIDLYIINEVAHVDLGQEGQGLAGGGCTPQVQLHGQEGRVVQSWGAANPPSPMLNLPGAGHGREDLPVPLTAPADSGQEGQGLAGGGCTLQVQMHGQEGRVVQRMDAAAVHVECTDGQKGLGNSACGATSTLQGATNFQDQILFKPGVLEALSGAVAALAMAKNSAMCTFNAGTMQGQTKRKEKRKKKGGNEKSQTKRKEKRRKKKGGNEKSQSARKEIIGKKRGNPFGAPPTGSDLNFSFERELESYEKLLYGEMSVSSKRICMGRVETMGGGDGIVTHVAKETEEEDVYLQQRRESVGDDGASAASEEEVRRAK